MTPQHTQQILTEAAQLADNVRQADIGDTFQLTTDARRKSLATHVPRLNVPRYQRHGGVPWVRGPNPTLMGGGRRSFEAITTHREVPQENIIYELGLNNLQK